jgi:hypothetical protein
MDTQATMNAEWKAVFSFQFSVKASARLMPQAENSKLKTVNYFIVHRSAFILAFYFLIIHS